MIECCRLVASPGGRRCKGHTRISAEQVSIQLLQCASLQMEQLLREGAMQERLRPLDQLALLDVPDALLKVPCFLLISCTYHRRATGALMSSLSQYIYLLVQTFQKSSNRAGTLFMCLQEPWATIIGCCQDQWYRLA